MEPIPILAKYPKPLSVSVLMCKTITVLILPSIPVSKF
jgi:hypothetical protein